jgi:hypothetical protein
MFEFVKSEKYSLAFSFILGVGIVSLFKPVCRDAECSKKTAANPEEVLKTTYQIGSKCYQFGMVHKECSVEGIIEA